MRRLWCLALWVVLGLWPARAQAVPHGLFNRPEDDWRVLETRHFRIYYTDATPLSAARLAEIADGTFERLNAFYGYAPNDKIGVTLVGFTGFSNGFAESGRNRITLYTTPANFHVRSRSPWLENVFTHELSHVLSLNTATAFPGRIPLVLGTGAIRSSESEAVVRLPLYTGNHPHWFSEGVAQFDTEQTGGDRFDENREAFERAALEDGLYYSLDRLAFFGDERWYNTGFGFLRYLERRFGKGTVHRIFRDAGQHYDLVFASLFQRVLGIPLSELERDFRADIEHRLAAHRRAVYGGRDDGVRVQLPDEDPRFESLTSLERERLGKGYTSRIVRSSGDRVYYRQGELVHRARFVPGPEPRLEDDQVLGEGYALAPHTDSSFFLLRQEGHSPSLVPSWYRPEFESPSLFVVDEDGNERRLLAESRLLDIDVCPARRELAAVYNDGDGSLRLALYPLLGFGTQHVRVDLRGRSFPLPPQAFDEVRSPRYSPDCSKLFFSRRVGDDHDVYAWDFRTRRAAPFVNEEAFELYPEPVSDGVYFVSARDGTMSVYFRSYAGGALRRVTGAVTSHHYPVRAPHGVFVARLRGTGFHAYYLDDSTASRGWAFEPTPKADPGLRRAPAPVSGRGYAPFTPKDWTRPSVVPMLDFEYQHVSGRGRSALDTQVGLEFYLEDQLRTHALWFRGFVGNRNDVFLSYRNDMSPLTLEARAGYSQDRDTYTYPRPDGQSFDHVTDGRWGFLYGSAALPLDNFWRVGVEAETIRDIGTTLSAAARDADFANPRYTRDRAGAFIAFSGLDRTDPAYRERWVNKRGYRESDLRASYAVEELDRSLAAFGMRTGRRPYLRAELEHHEYLALPPLFRGSFDHTLEVNLKLGWISRDVGFLPFYGGGRLYSQSTPELNTSVGFTGYSSYSLSGESLANLAVAYRFPLLRGLSWDLGPFFLEDVYAQLFTSWGNIWGFDADGTRQRPFLDRAANGRRVVGDVGADLRLFSFFQEIDANMGTTLRLVYRAVPFARCPAGDDVCFDVDGRYGLRAYLMFGAGF
jgi:hypothetical protein